MKRTLFILSVLAFSVVFAEKMPFKRYQTIIDRQPFGQPPPGFNPEQMASDVSRADASAEQELSQEQAAIQKAVAFSVINADPDDGGVMVGFTDNADPKIPRHYYMRVGTTRDGWQVKEADLLKKTMTVVKDGVEVTLELGSNSSGAEVAKSSGAAAPSRATGAHAASAPATGRSGLLSRRPGGGAASSFQGRRRQREIAEAQEKADAEAREAERKRQAEEHAAQAEAEKVQREQERAEQREQLMAIQSELRRVREEKERARAAESEAAGGDGDGGTGDES